MTCIIYVDDVLSARYKLAEYYLREFTEISLFSFGDRMGKKAPLTKLYVSMEWKRVKDEVSLSDYLSI